MTLKRSFTVACTLSLALCVFLDGLSTGSVQAQFTGQVGGVVSNGTSGASVPEGFEVVLITTDLEGKPVDQKTTRVDSRGVFSFTNVRSGQDVVNRVLTDYQGVISAINLQDELAPANLKVQIFETTRSLETIEVTSHALVVRPDASISAMGILEYVTFRNSGDRTFVADLTDPKVTGLSMFRFGLPPGFEGLSGISVDPPLPAGQLVEVGPGFALTNPIPPGEYRLLFEYFVPYDGSTLEFAKNLPFGARELRVLMLKEAGRVSGDGLKPGEDVTLGLSTYSVVTGANFARGRQVALMFGELPEPPLLDRITNAIDDSSDAVKIGVPVAAGALLAALLGYVFVVRRRRTGSAVAKGADVVEADAQVERATLIQQIAELDTRFEAGEIAEAEYRSRRAELAARATGLPGR